MDFLSSAAFGMVPAGQLFARELHGAHRVGLGVEQIPTLVESCTLYTAASDVLMVQMAAQVAQVHQVMFGETLPTKAKLDGVDKLLVGWSYRGLELGRTWVRHRMIGLRDLSADQVKAVAAEHDQRTALLRKAWATGALDESVPLPA
ncbi:hypothetical protein [Frankia sp. AgB32]|uniref:hypothetical protein n=1 Tax=Frankia sp. AgB32 TaxID=631119 RepID=UPI00200C2720|nr:hypothetical protein [Frankia sp. AgB32]MCK9893373.1 hypothetical protein [Frankia sp. AgB32]